MRSLLLSILLCTGAAAQQQPPTLVQFLGLTATQTSAIQQLNDTFSQFVRAKQQQINTINNALNGEYGRPAPDPLFLGQRYLEIDSINQQIADQRESTHQNVTALLTPSQVAVLGQISRALVQVSLLQDASCAFLGDAFRTVPTLAQRLGNFVFADQRPNLVGAALQFVNSPYQSCGGLFPISIRDYLTLTDSQVADVLSVENSFTVFQTQKQNRIADVQVEIRDETAKPNPDPLALGVRYAEILEISQELTQADGQGRTTARTVLTPGQQAKLQTLRDSSSLTQYEFVAESCRFIPVPAGLPDYYSGQSCFLN